MTEFKLDLKTGLLSPVKFVPSPNSDHKLGIVDTIIVHSISLPPGEFGGDYIKQLFTNCLNQNEHPYFNKIKDYRVSAHCLIRRDGEIIQFVPFTQRAWHAGQSEFMGRKNCNDFSFGIEVEGDQKHDFTNNQYQVLANLIKLLCHHFPEISPDRIIGHSHVAPGRKTDPGPRFDWELLAHLTELVIDPS